MRFVRVIGRERPRSSGEEKEREDIEWTVDEWCSIEKWFDAWRGVSAA